MLIRLTTGASWVDIEAILDHQVSDTTLRARRDEWVSAGVFDKLRVEAMAAFDRLISPTPDLALVRAIEGRTQQKAVARRAKQIVQDAEAAEDRG